MKTILAVLKLFPLILTAVRAVEEAIPLPGQGNKKLELVLDVLKAAYDASAELNGDLSWQNLVKVIVPMIEKIVAVYNALGVFQKSTQPNNV